MNTSSSLAVMFVDTPKTDEGFIDTHCHLLPGVDDGCRTMEETLNCVREWMQAGFVGSVCTPHLGPNWYEDNTPDRLAKGIEGFRAALRSAGLDYQLWDGGEVRISAETIDWFSYWGLPTLGPGRCVLIDWWGDTWPLFCDETCRFLLDNGYQPILAHPERMALSERNWNQVLERLENMGVWLQGNLNSFAGGEGKHAKSRALKLLREDRYFLLASDTHGPDSIPGRRHGMESLISEFGNEKLTHLIDQRPRQVLLHEAVV